jgi:thiamine biosynthesis lipoprotein
MRRVAVDAMGCRFEAFVADQDAGHADAVAEEALAEVVRLDRQLSHHRADSDICRINALAGHEWVRVEPLLFGLLRRCAEWTAATGGAFDVACGAILEAWDFHTGTGRLAGGHEVRAGLDASGTDRVLFDVAANLVHFAAPGLLLNLGAVGKGYALDEAARILRFYGTNHALLHGGRSTIVAVGPPPGSDPWHFIIRDPRDRTTPVASVRLRDAALSTSGSYRQNVEVGGVTYGHIVDPRTGRPADGMLSVSVCAPSAAESDALSTAFYVMGRDETARFCGSRPDLAVVLLEVPAGSSAGAPAPLTVTRIGRP